MPADSPDLPDAWRRALGGDRDAFEEAVEPHQATLLRSARRLVGLERDQDRLAETDLTPEELMGEGLIRAWENRARFDADRMRLRAWLLGVQRRALDALLRREDRWNRRKAVSLDEEVPQNAEQDAVEESMYEFQLPYDVTTFEDIIPGSAPDDVEVDRRSGRLTDDERELLAQAGLSDAARDVALFHDEFELSLSETAQILDASLKDTAENLNLARTTLRDHVGSADGLDDDPSDATDSYTGDAV